MGKVRKNLGLGLILLSCVFLFEPRLSVFDFLPDLVGYILLCVGISQLADMNYHFEESLRYFKRMVWVNAIHLATVFILFGLVTGKERPAAFLLTTFTFAVIEVIFLVHAYNEFFEGFLYMGSRMNATAVFHISEARLRRREARRMKEEARIERDNEIRRHKGLRPRRMRTFRPLKNDTSRTAGFTVVFVVAKAVLTALPEFSALTEQTSDPYANFVFWYDYIDLYRSFAVLVMFPLGIIWLRKMIRYIRSIIRDTDFMRALTEKYVAEVEPKTYLFIQRAIKLAFLVMSIGVFFCLDFSIENHTINLIPDFLCPIILVLSLVLLKKFVKIPPVSYALCGLYTVISAWTYWLSADFYSNYTLSLANIRVEAYEAFRFLTYIKIADSIVFLLMILSLYPVLNKIIDCYTGFAPSENANVQTQDKIRYVHGMLRKKLYVFIGLAALCSISGICCILLAKNANFIWMIDLVVCSVFAIYTVTMLNGISEEVEYKYLLA